MEKNTMSGSNRRQQNFVHRGGGRGHRGNRGGNRGSQHGGGPTRNPPQPQNGGPTRNPPQPQIGGGPTRNPTQPQHGGGPTRNPAQHQRGGGPTRSVPQKGRGKGKSSSMDMQLPLFEMFMDVLDPEIIQTVAHQCNYNLDTTVEKLLALTDNDQSQPKPKQPTTKGRLEDNGGCEPEKFPSHKGESKNPWNSQQALKSGMPTPPGNGGASVKYFPNSKGNQPKQYKDGPNFQQGYAESNNMNQHPKNRSKSAESWKKAGSENHFSEALQSARETGMSGFPVRCGSNVMEDDDADVIVEEENDCQVVNSPFTPFSFERPSFAKGNTGGGAYVLSNILQNQPRRTSSEPPLKASTYKGASFAKKTSNRSVTDTVPESILQDALHINRRKLSSDKKKTKNEEVSPLDKARKYIEEGVKILILVRGVPGSGKTYLSEELKSQGVVLSTDHFFEKRNGTYQYNPKQIPEAHEWNKKRAQKALKQGVTPIIIDNTNTQAWEMRPYAAMAVNAGYRVEVVEPNTKWKFNARELAQRNIHGVGRNKIQEMLERYETNLSANKLLKQMNLKQPTKTTSIKFANKQQKSQTSHLDRNDNASEKNMSSLFRAALQAVGKDSDHHSSKDRIVMHAHVSSLPWVSPPELQVDANVRSVEEESVSSEDLPEENWEIVSECSSSSDSESESVDEVSRTESLQDENSDTEKVSEEVKGESIEDNVGNLIYISEDSEGEEKVNESAPSGKYTLPKSLYTCMLEGIIFTNENTEACSSTHVDNSCAEATTKPKECITYVSEGKEVPAEVNMEMETCKDANTEQDNSIGNASEIHSKDINIEEQGMQSLEARNISIKELTNICSESSVSVSEICPPGSSAISAEDFAKLEISICNNLKIIESMKNNLKEIILDSSETAQQNGSENIQEGVEIKQLANQKESLQIQVTEFLAKKQCMENFPDTPVMDNDLEMKDKLQFTEKSLKNRNNEIIAEIEKKDAGGIVGESENNEVTVKDGEDQLPHSDMGQNSIALEAAWFSNSNEPLCSSLTEYKEKSDDHLSALKKLTTQSTEDPCCGVEKFDLIDFEGATETGLFAKRESIEEAMKSSGILLPECAPEDNTWTDRGAVGENIENALLDSAANVTENVLHIGNVGIKTLSVTEQITADDIFLSRLLDKLEGLVINEESASNSEEVVEGKPSTIDVDSVQKVEDGIVVTNKEDDHHRGKDGTATVSTENLMVGDDDDLSKSETAANVGEPIQNTNNEEDVQLEKNEIVYATALCVEKDKCSVDTASDASSSADIRESDDDEKADETGPLTNSKDECNSFVPSPFSVQRNADSLLGTNYNAKLLELWEKGGSWNGESDGNVETVNTGENSIPKPSRELSRPKKEQEDRLDVFKSMSGTEAEEEIIEEVPAWDSVAGQVAWDSIDVESPRKEERKCPRPQRQLFVDKQEVAKSSDAPGPVNPLLCNHGHQSCWLITPDKFLLKESGTVTSHRDFLLANDNFSELELDKGTKILATRSRNICENVEAKPVEKFSTVLKLDKSSMTEDMLEGTDGGSLSELQIMFPHIAQEDLADLYNKCQQNVNWAADILLDSDGHGYKRTLNEDSKNDSDSEGRVEDITEDDNRANNLDYDNVDENSLDITDSIGCKSRKFKRVQSGWSIQLKKELEGAISVNDSIASRKEARLKKVNEAEGDGARQINVAEDDGVRPMEEDVYEEHAEDMTSDKVSSGGTNEEEEETFTMMLDPKFAADLHNYFASPSSPLLTGLPQEAFAISIPMSLARHLHYHWMETLQQQFDRQEEMFKDMIHEDEELAKKLQEEENEQCKRSAEASTSSPAVADLREIMDMEMALAIYKADQDEVKKQKQNKENLANMLTRHLLYETFPNIDKDVLNEVFQAHDSSYEETVNVLTASIENHGQVKTVMSPEARYRHEKALIEQAKQESMKSLQEKEQELRVVELQPVDSERQAYLNYREEASSHYELRMECYRKAQEAYQKGMKSVASYYAELGTMHKQKIDESNAKAAASLLESQVERQQSTMLDLHFMYVQEAVQVLDLFLDHHKHALIESGQKKVELFIITGKGNHSIGGRSRIKPAVIDRLQHHNLGYEEENAGLLKVVLTKRAVLRGT